MRSTVARDTDRGGRLCAAIGRVSRLRRKARTAIHRNIEACPHRPWQGPPRSAVGGLRISPLTRDHVHLGSGAGAGLSGDFSGGSAKKTAGGFVTVPWAVTPVTIG